MSIAARIRKGLPTSVAAADGMAGGSPWPAVTFAETGADATPAPVVCMAVGRLVLLLVEIDAAHAATIEAPPASVVLWLAVDRRRPAAWNGVRLRRGEIVLQGPRTVAVLRADGPCRWGAVAIDGVALAAAARALLDRDIVALTRGCILKPTPDALRELRHLHGQACRLAGRRPALFGRPEVARAFEQGLIHALVGALATAVVRRSGPAESA